MALQAIAFYLLATVTIGSGLAVVSVRNPVHSVLFLILTFFSAAGLFLLLGKHLFIASNATVYLSCQIPPFIQISNAVLHTDMRPPQIFG